MEKQLWKRDHFVSTVIWFLNSWVLSNTNTTLYPVSLWYPASYNVLLPVTYVHTYLFITICLFRFIFYSKKQQAYSSLLSGTTQAPLSTHLSFSSSLTLFARSLAGWIGTACIDFKTIEESLASGFATCFQPTERYTNNGEIKCE